MKKRIMALAALMTVSVMLTACTSTNNEASEYKHGTVTVGRPGYEYSYGSFQVHRLKF